MIFCVVSYDTAGQLQFFFRSEYYSILVTYIADNTSSVSNIDDFQMAMALRLVWHSSSTTLPGLVSDSATNDSKKRKSFTE